MENKPLLSISILVSNRIDTIRKCMESIKPLLTEMPCELVAVDTVGEATDGSIDVVREYTDKIYRFEWCNDFAKARNFGLEKCTGEWFMFMDDDEWFEDVSEIRDFFLSGEYKQYQCANYNIHSYSDTQGSYSTGSMFRMTKREENTRFIGRVHERLEPLRAPAKEFSAYIHHYGYMFETEEEKRKHSERNISLLEPEFQKNPWNMHVRAQLIQEYAFLKDLREKALLLCEETLCAEKKYYFTKEFQWILLMYVRIPHVEKQYEHVIENANQLKKRFPLNELTEMAINMLEIEARYVLGQYEEGVLLWERIVKKRNYLLVHPEKKQYQLYIDFSNFLDDSWYYNMLSYGIRCNLKCGNSNRAEELTGEWFALKEKPLLSVSIMVSNHKDTVRKCLESIQPLLKVVPSELIIVDTVGEEQSDGSLAVAKEYTENIVPFVWCDDFAAARNAGLQKAAGEWFLYLDDDEWFESIEEIVRFFVSGEFFEYNSGVYYVRNYKDAAGNVYTDDIAARLVRRAKDMRFIGCINESFSAFYQPCKELHSYVHHYGFVYESEEEKKHHRSYTKQLLEKDLERYPEYIKNRMRLIAIYTLEAPEKALELVVDTYSVCKTDREQKELLQLGIICAKRQQQYAVAWSFYEAMPWETMDASAEETLLKLFAMTEEYTDEDTLFRIVKRIMANGQLKPVLGKLMQIPQIKQQINRSLEAQKRKQ